MCGPTARAWQRAFGESAQRDSGDTTGGYRRLLADLEDREGILDRSASTPSANRNTRKSCAACSPAPGSASIRSRATRLSSS